MATELKKLQESNEASCELPACLKDNIQFTI